MSAIHDSALIDTKLRKYNSKAKVLVHSHRLDEGVEVAKGSVFNIQISKTVKGVGTANIGLIASANWLNVFGPNDIVNIYFDQGDGKGWVRTFFGFIDRIEESYTVSDTGEPTTLYYLICSDFAKAFAVTNIYSNPSLLGRQDFMRLLPGLRENRPGFALFSSGLLAFGTPGDLIRNIITVTLGWGGQFTLPKSYSSALDPSFIDTNRQGRIESAERTFFGNTFEDNFGADGLSSIVEEQTALANNSASALLASSNQGDLSSVTQAVAAESGVSVEDLTTLLGQDEQDLRAILQNSYISRALNTADNEQARRAAASINSSLPGSPTTVVDLIDLVNFVEREALDGFTSRIPTADFLGSVEKLIRSFVNEPVNELFFDLRPVSAGESIKRDGTDWSTDPDEVGGNLGEDGSVAGVKYVPAVVLREFPFSTVEELDASSVEMSLRDESSNQNLNFGFIYFGAIFSDRAEVPGRHLVSAPNINVVDKAQGVTTPTYRCLDVAVISPEEIRKTSFGRSDTDVVNLVQLHAATSLGSSSKYILKDLIPIFTPISFSRNGLRVRELTTRFAILPGEPVPESSTTTVTSSGSPAAPAAARNEVLNTSDPTALIINGNPYYPEGVSVVNWLDPSVPNGQLEFFVNPQSRGPGDVNEFIIHEPGGGKTIDRLVQTLRSRNVSVQLGLDGEGVFHQFGDLALMNAYHGGHHNRFSIGCEVLGPYNLQPNEPWTRSISNAAWCSRDSNGSKEYVVPTPAQAEAMCSLITFLATAQPEGINIPLNWKGYLSSSRFSMSRVEGADRPSPGIYAHCYWHHGDGAWLALYCFLRIEAKMDPFTAYEEAITRSSIPRRYADISGLDVRGATPVVRTSRYRGTGGTPDGVNEDFHGGAERDVAQSQQRVETQEAVQATNTRTTSGRVDSDSTRTMIARWGLLQDHWYQHNAEYLSGTIDMRGAPEIRVGYRLDLLKRNLSFYVEGVKHVWTYPGKLSTNLTVTRGQPNNPYPSYTLPTTDGFAIGPSQRAADNSRLGEFFIIQDTFAQYVGKMYGGQHLETLVENGNLSRTNSYKAYRSPNTNVLDTEPHLEAKEESYVLATAKVPQRLGEQTVEDFVNEEGILDVEGLREAGVDDDLLAIVDQLREASGVPTENAAASLHNTGFSANIPGADE